jgi:hypothetical protein
MEMEISNQCPFDPAHEANRQAFDYIKNLHAHSDVAETLVKSLKPCGEVQVFSPDSYRYVTVSTQGIIFGFAVEMDTMAFRLSKRMKEIALETGAMAFPQCGEDWVNLLPFRCDWPKVDFEFWALKAYLNIRESVGLA